MKPRWLLIPVIFSLGAVAAAVMPTASDLPAAQELLAAQEAIGDMTADFELTIYGAGKNGSDTKAQGKMWVAKGRRYAVQYKKPERQQLVSDGKQRWLYLEKINQVQIQSLPPAGNPAEFFLELGGGLPSLIRQCEVKRFNVGPELPGTKGFELLPKSNQLSFTRARLWLRGSQLTPAQAVVESGHRVQVKFHGVKIHTAQELLQNPQIGIPAATFTFQPPAGAEVVQMF